MMLKQILSVVNFLAQTSAQKASTLVGVGCMMVAFLIFLIGDSKFSAKQRWILFGFLLAFAVAFIVLLFVDY